MNAPNDLRDRRLQNKDDAVPTLPPKDPRDIGPKAKMKQNSVNLPLWLWERLDEIAEQNGYTRNEAINALLRQFVDERDATAAAPKKTSNAK